MKKNGYSFYCVFIMLFCLDAMAQVSSEIVQQIPMTPEAYQFKKNLVSNVSYYTGQVDVSIPIHTIKLDDIEIPISISCNTSGIKVEEEASIVGLGWMLNIGGEISRNNHGAPDERALTTAVYNGSNGIGWMKTEIPKCTTCGIIDWEPFGHVNFYNEAGWTEHYSRLQTYNWAMYNSNPYLAYQNTIDFRPDEFHYSFLGHSGKFMYDQATAKFVTFPLDDIKILPNRQYEQGSGYVFNSFNISLPNGYNVTLGSNGRRSVRKNSGPKFDQSWQIKKIVSPQYNEVNYNYIDSEFASCTQNDYFEDYAAGGSTYTYGNCYDYRNFEGLVSSIIFPSGKIEFTYVDREDILGSKRLSEINVYDVQNALVKKVKLVQSYFVANESTTEGDHIKKRLRLNSVEVYGSTLNDPQKYLFDYYTFGNIPHKKSYGQDHWGYFNGRFNGSMFPDYIFEGQNLPMGTIIPFRDIDATYCQTFLLKKIQYPEGATKVFTYESHKAPADFTNSHLFNQISDELYAPNWYGLSISGYALDNFYPAPQSISPAPYTLLLNGPTFDITFDDKELMPGEENFSISSNLPFQFPNYNLIMSSYNNVQFFIEKKLPNNTFERFRNLGTISKDENASGNIGYRGYELPVGTYRMVIMITRIPSSEIKYHYSSIGYKTRKKVKTVYSVGGVRIKKIDTYPSNGLSGEKYTTDYSYLDDGGYESGKVTGVPFYSEARSYNLPPSSPTDSGRRHVRSFRRTSRGVLPMLKTSGSYIGYTKVTKTDTYSSGTIKEEYYYTFQHPKFSDLSYNDYLRDQEPKDWHRGKLLMTKYFNNSTLMKEEIYEYNGETLEYDKGFVEEINTDLLDQTQLTHEVGVSSKCITLTASSSFHFYNKYDVDNISGQLFYGGENPSVIIPYFKLYTGFDKIASKTTNSYFQGNKIVEKEEYQYGQIPQYTVLTSVLTTKSDGTKTRKKFYYPQSSSGEPFMNDLISRNRVGETVKTEVFKVDPGNLEVKLSESKSKYGAFYSNYQLSQGDDPSSYTNTINPLLLVKEQYSKKGNGIIGLADRKVSIKRDDFWGNVTEYTKENGNPVSIIWGYNHSQPIATLENLAYSSIPLQTLRDLKNLSFADNDNCRTPLCKEQILRVALNTLRTQFPNSMVTTYTYDNLIGVTSITKPNGDTQYYTYDTFGRLSEVRDQDGNILTANKYHFRPQIP